MAQFRLRISILTDFKVPPHHPDSHISIESFDFGSCVALHRFLYDHWDHVRQTLVTRERKEYLRSPGEVPRGRSPVLEPLRNLIANLGPPPLAVSWNRPQVSANSPPLYSRFQNFMLRNAFRSTESFLTARAVYDGGESKVKEPYSCPGVLSLTFNRTVFRSYASFCATLRLRASTTIHYYTVISR